MREYRGKSVLSIEELNNKEIPHENGWVYGWYVDGWIVGNYAESEDEWIAFEWWSQVIPETVGQSTGLHDKNGVEIFEGDVLEVTILHQNRKITMRVEWLSQSCMFWLVEGMGAWDDENTMVLDLSITDDGVEPYRTFEVIGNIHNKDGDELSNFVPVEFDPMLGQSESED